MESNNYNLRDPSLFNSQGLIGGSWKFAPLGKTFPVIDPSTGDVLRQCADFTKQDFIDAIESAHDGYQEFYYRTTSKERGVILRKWNDLTLANLEDCEIL